jgi:hypothetical protein
MKRVKDSIADGVLTFEEAMEKLAGLGEKRERLQRFVFQLHSIIVEACRAKRDIVRIPSGIEAKNETKRRGAPNTCMRRPRLDENHAS